MKFLRSQLAAFAGSITDFLIAMLLHGVFNYSFVTANIGGNIAGGVTNFYLGRIWVFNEKQTPVRSQFIKYVMVWAGNMVLNTGGVFLMTHYAGLKFLNSKIIVSVIIGFFYNFLLQQNFVFKSSDDADYKMKEG